MCAVLVHGIAQEGNGRPSTHPGRVKKLDYSSESAEYSGDISVRCLDLLDLILGAATLLFQLPGLGLEAILKTSC